MPTSSLTIDAALDLSPAAGGDTATARPSHPDAPGDPAGLLSCDLPELGHVYRGKVRDCYTFEHAGRALRALVATDRISAFDRVFAEPIPGKGAILNGLSAYFLERAATICPTHLVAVPDPNVTIARELAPYPVEVVVRGYLAGSAWRDYQEGVFEARYGIALPPGLTANARLAEPILTPTSKATQGHDLPLSAVRAAELVGGEATWREICRTALALFAQGAELAAERGLILVDTKYEFGHDDGVLTLMDEIHTPDSSRYWYRASYERDPQAPEQLSKEFLRDWLRERGFTGDGPAPELPYELRLEVARRYQEVYRTLTGRSLDGAGAASRQRLEPGRAGLSVSERIVRNLEAAGYLKGSFVAILQGSASDRAVGDRLAAKLAELGIPSQQTVVSAHKVPDRLYQLISELNASAEPVVVVTIAGRSNGLSGAAAANSVHPVVALPVFADRSDYLVNIHSSLQMPGDTPALVVLDPDNAALACARMLALADAGIAARVAARIATVRAAYGDPGRAGERGRP